MKTLPLLLIVLIFSGYVHADGLSYTFPGCTGSSDFLSTLTNLPFCIVESFFAFIVSGLIAALQGLIDASFKFLFSSPDPRLFCSSYNAIMAVIESLYAIALMGLALMFIVRSNDVEGRLAAKQWLQNLISMIVVLSVSFLLFQTLLDFNTYLSTSIANEAMKTIFTPSGSFTSAIFALLMLLLIASLLLLTFVTLLLRYILIPFLLLLFPVAIFLYFTPLTQSWGKAFLKAIAIVVFMTSFDTLILLGLSALFSSANSLLADSLVKAFAILFGFGALGLINIFLFLTAIFSVVRQSKLASAAIGIIIAKKVLKR